MTINKHLGIREESDGSASLVVSPHHLNRNGSAHGGVLCTLADWAMASEVLARLPSNQTTATIDLITKYLLPAALNEKLRTRVQVTNHSRRLISLECEVVSSSDKVISKSYATFMIINRENSESSKMTVKATVKPAGTAAYQEAARLLAQGGLVVTPTRTNYNLVCDPRNATAIQRVFEVKKRTKFGPLLILIDQVAQALDYGELPAGYRLADLERIWPSELTIIMKKRYPFPPQLTLGLETLGISCQGDSEVREVIRAFGFPVAATSANISGQGDVFVDLEKAVADLGDKVDLIIDSGSASVAAQSDIPDKSNSIIDITFDRPYLVRKGLVTVERIAGNFPNLETDVNLYKEKLRQRVEETQTRGAVV